MIRRPPRSTLSSSSAASDVYKRQVVLFEEALAELSGVPIDRVTSYIHDRNISGLSALYRKAGLPDTAYPAFRAAIAAMREGALVGERGGAARLKRRMVAVSYTHLRAHETRH